MKLETLSTSVMEINSKWIKDLNVKSEIVKLLEENIGKSYQHCCQQWFSRYKTKSIIIKSKNNEGGYIKLKSFCKAK